MRAQHVAPSDQPRALCTAVDKVRAGGMLTMTLRHGPDDGRSAHPVSDSKILALARAYGMLVLRRVDTSDLLGRSDVRWTAIVLRLPDDGTGTLPLLRHHILADAKSATYNLGLLRALCRAADGAAGLGERREEGTVTLPLGLVALIWLRLYLPLIRADLPQAPRNLRGGEGLGFAGPGWNELALGAVSDQELRVGASFGGSEAAAVHIALQEAADLICRMPATYLTYPNGGKIVATTRRRSVRPSAGLRLDRETLLSFGEVVVPEHLWVALDRFAPWIEPALIAEWSRLMQAYAARQGRQVAIGTIAAAMTWSEPTRDVAVTRSIALDLLDREAPVHCVWSGKRLGPDTLDVDHCLPWSAWPCGDLWNLMPTDRRVNQRLKRERLPSAETLAAAGDAIMSWWETAYLGASTPLLPLRFRTEASASLPALLGDASPEAGAVLSAVALQRMRLSRDQGVPQWSWP